MSLFGTLRKKGKKVHVTLSRTPIFSSTPNLNAVSLPKSDDRDTCVKPVPTHSFKSQHPDHADTDQTELIPTGGLDAELKKYDVKSPTTLTLTVPTDSGGGSMKSFMSLVSMASSLKRLKKDKKKPFASASNLHRIETDTREAVIFEDSSAAAAPRLDNQLNVNVTMLKAIKSAPALELPKTALPRSEVCDDEPGSNNNSNTEPGVISSSSSTSSCNQSDTGSISSYNTSSLPRPARGFSSSTSSLGLGFGAKGKKSKSTRNDSTSEDVSFETSVNTKYVQDINKTQTMLQGAKKFNMDPKRGIDFLVLNGIIERTPEDVARFLKDGEGLSKTAIGNYLGEYTDFNLAVLQAFVNLHDFTDVLLVQALRQFLWSFRLPGESQKIDRMMESFAKRYCQLNPNLFKDSDTCYLLSFAIIMLNTALHNPNVKTKTTLEQFIRMTDSEEKDRSFITSLYNSILEEPFKIPQEDGNDFVLTFFNPDIEGWLWKQGGHYKTWKRRWFILSNNCLYYFHYTTDRVPRGIIPLENIDAKTCPSNATHGSKHRYCFILQKKQTFDTPHLRVTDYIKSCKTLSDGQTVPGKHLTYTLATSSEAERTRWVEAISQNSSSHDFYTLLAQKKNRIQALQQKNQSTKRGTMTIGRTKKSRSANSKSVRKSQISLPLTTALSATSLSNSNSPLQDPLKDSTSAEYNYYSYLAHPEKNPHSYFLTLPSAKSKGLSLSHDSVSAQTNSNSGHSGADGEHASSSEGESEDDDESIPVTTVIFEPGPEVPDSRGESRRESYLSNDEESTSASDFLIRKYSLPVQESASAMLKRYDSIIGPRVTLTEPEPKSDGINLPGQATRLGTASPQTENAEVVTLPMPSTTPKVIQDHHISTTPSSSETEEDIYGSISQAPKPKVKSDDSPESLAKVKSKRRTYKKQTSLDRHVEEILAKQTRCVSDVEITKARRSMDESESKKVGNAEVTIERVTSFSKSIITTTVVKMVRLSTTQAPAGECPCPGPAHDGEDLGAARHEQESVPTSHAHGTSVCSGDDDHKYGTIMVRRNSSFLTPTTADDDKVLAESFSSIVIGNVRHTEV